MDSGRNGDSFLAPQMLPDGPDLVHPSMLHPPLFTDVSYNNTVSQSRFHQRECERICHYGAQQQARKKASQSLRLERQTVCIPSTALKGLGYCSKGRSLPTCSRDDRCCIDDRTRRMLTWPVSSGYLRMLLLQGSRILPSSFMIFAVEARPLVSSTLIKYPKFEGLIHIGWSFQDRSRYGRQPFIHNKSYILNCFFIASHVRHSLSSERPSTKPKTHESRSYLDETLHDVPRIFPKLDHTRL